MALEIGRTPNHDDHSSPEEEPKPTDDILGKEIGIELNLPFSTQYTDVNAKSGDPLYELSRNTFEHQGPNIIQLNTMRRMDGQARALYRLLTLPIRAALTKATFIPDDGGDEEAEFITQVFELPPQNGGMSVTFHRFMAQLLMALFDGFSAFEQVYWQPDKGPLAGKYTLKKLAHRPSDTITFLTDEFGSWQGFRQRAYINNKIIDVKIPRENAFYFAAQEEERKFYGVSYFQSAFYHYDKKIKVYFLAHLAAQRAAVGTRVGTHPANAGKNDKTTFGSYLSNLAIAQYMMIPEGYKVEILKEGGQFDFLDYINHHNSQMSKSILATFFDDNTGSGSSGDTLISNGQPGDEMFMLMLKTIMDEIANSINHYIIPRIIDWNFSGGHYPKFTWGVLTDDQRAMVANLFQTLATGQPNVTPEFMREIEKHMADELGLEIDYDEVDKREAQEAIELKAQEEEMMRQGAVVADATAVQKTAQANKPTVNGMPRSPGAKSPAGAPKAGQVTPRSIAKPTVKPAARMGLTAEEEAEETLLQLAAALLDSATPVEDEEELDDDLTE